MLDIIVKVNFAKQSPLEVGTVFTPLTSILFCQTYKNFQSSFSYFSVSSFFFSYNWDIINKLGNTKNFF